MLLLIIYLRSKTRHYACSSCTSRRRYEYRCAEPSPAIDCDKFIDCESDWRGSRYTRSLGDISTPTCVGVQRLEQVEEGEGSGRGGGRDRTDCSVCSTHGSDSTWETRISCSMFSIVWLEGHGQAS
jgi:hypothetical protein